MPHTAPVGYYKRRGSTHPVHARTGMARVGTVHIPQSTMSPGRRAMPTQKRVVSIAKGNAKPRTVEEARLVLVYMEEQRKVRQAKELEAKKAFLCFDRGTGTTAR